MTGRPTTVAEAKRYRYGRWAGNEKGTPYREGYCIAEFVPNERVGLPRQCGQRAMVWCRAHDPERVAAKARQWQAKFDAKQAADDAAYKQAIQFKRRLGVGQPYYQYSHRGPGHHTGGLVLTPEECQSLLVRLRATP